MRLFIKLSYNGRKYNGWQVQPGHPSVQETLERALTIWFKEKIQVTGAGRTDSGVSAVNYIAHFDLSTDILTLFEEPQKRIFKINAILPTDIVVHDIWRFLYNPGLLLLLQSSSHIESGWQGLIW